MAGIKLYSPLEHLRIIEAVGQGASPCLQACVRPKISNSSLDPIEACRDAETRQSEQRQGNLDEWHINAQGKPAGAG